MDFDNKDVAIVAAISLLCGIASWMQGRREGRNESVWDLGGELLNSLVAGAIAFCGGKYEEFNQYCILLAVLMAANNATEVRQKCRDLVRGIEISKIMALLGKGKK